MSLVGAVSGAVRESQPPVDVVVLGSAEPTIPANIVEQAVSDDLLLEQVRQGELSAYAVLYERHLRVARWQARRLCRCGATADDLVSEAFVKVLAALLAGRGPGSCFRAYLLTTIRHLFYTAADRDRRLELVGDLTTIEGAVAGVAADADVLSQLDRALAATALERLPHRWQWVLQRTVVEGRRPGELAPQLGMRSNGVAALSLRARSGLRTEYLQAHLDDNHEVAPGCQATVRHLAARVRRHLPKRRLDQVDAHVAGCGPCRARLHELTEINDRLPA